MGTLDWVDKTTLRVRGIKEVGTVVTYNASHVSTPDMQVREGDCIVDVNGISGDKDKMLAELQCNKKFVLAVQRDGAAPAVQGTTDADLTEKTEPAPEQDPEEEKAECETADQVTEDRVDAPVEEEAVIAEVEEPKEPDGNTTDKGCGSW